MGFAAVYTAPPTTAKNDTRAADARCPRHDANPTAPLRAPPHVPARGLDTRGVSRSFSRPAVKNAADEAPPAASVAQRIERALGGPFASRLVEQRWGLVVTVVMLVASLWLYASTPISWTPGSDGFYSWIYARSLAFDGDLDFKNDYALCGDPFAIGIDRGTGHPDNIFYAGPALVWAPALRILRLVLGALPLRDSCGGRFSMLVLGLSPIMGALTAWLCYRLARRWFTDAIAALAVALVVLAGPVFKIATCLPSYSHTCDVLFVAALLVATARAEESPLQRRRWAWVALALGACIVQRLSNAMFALVPLVALAVTFSSRRREGLFAGALIGAATLAALGSFGALYQYLYGSPFVFTHGRYFLQLAHAHPFLLLFDEVQGVFFSAPALWLSVAGLGLALRDRGSRHLLIPLCVIAALEFYLSSAALDWAPARRLANLSPLGVVLACHSLRYVATWSRLPARALAAAAVIFASPFCLAALDWAWNAPRGHTTGDDLFARLGRLAVVPAEVGFDLRYHLPRDRFGDALIPRWYARNFRTLGWYRRDLPFTDPRLTRLMSGVAPAADGVKLTGARGRLVFAVQWPFATLARLRASGPSGAMVRLGEGRALGEPRWFGDAKPLLPVASNIDFALPPGEFSSGLHEVVFEITGDDAHAAVLVSLVLDDRAPRPLPFQR